MVIFTQAINKNIKTGDEKIPIHLYSKVRSDIVHRFSNYDCIKAIYEFGKTKNIGISDLDIALVLKNETQGANYLEDELKSVYKNKDYISVLCGGTIMVFSESDFANIYYLDDIEPKLLAGDKIRVNLPSKSEEKLILICQIFDWLPERLLSLKNVVTNGDSVISLLGYLYSLRYTFRKLNNFLTNGFDERLNFINSIEKIRSIWFELCQEDQRNELNVLVDSAFRIGFRDLSNVVSKLKLTGNYKSEECKVFSALFTLAPNKGFISSRKFGSMVIKDKKYLSQNVLIEVPMLWFYLWHLYASQTGPISRELSKHLCIEPENVFSNHFSLNTELKMMLIKRINLCNSMSCFLRRNGIQRGLYKFGWFY